MMLIIFISLYAFIYFQNNNIKVTKYDIFNNKIPSSFNEYKIIQVSDYHNSKNIMLNEKLTRIIEKEKPNLIVVTGDLIDSTNTNVEQALKLIDELKKYSEILFVSGNHEKWTNKYEELNKGLIKREIEIINNKDKSIDKEDVHINILGVEDSETIDILRENLKRLKKDNNIFNILLSHRPEYFKEYVEEGIDLVLTGHAHGGQIRFFNKGLVAPNQGLFPKYTAGLIKEKDTIMITSSGLGNSVIPIRLNNHPELVVITLKNK